MSKRIPKFKNEDEEREFWATHDSTEYINWNQAERITFSNLKPSVKKYHFVFQNLCWKNLNYWQIKEMFRINLF